LKIAISEVERMRRVALRMSSRAVTQARMAAECYAAFGGDA